MENDLRVWEVEIEGRMDGGGWMDGWMVVDGCVDGRWWMGVPMPMVGTFVCLESQERTMASQPMVR